MKTPKILYYISFGFIGLLLSTVVVSSVYHRTYARHSNNITECETIHKFANLTIPRTLKAGTAPYVNTRLARVTTSLLVYSTSELDKVGLLDTLYQQAVTDRVNFFGVGDNYDNRAVVLLQTIPSNNNGEEPLYCVVGTNKVTIDLLRTDAQFNLAVRPGRKSDFAFESSNTVISWGRYW